MKHKTVCDKVPGIHSAICAAASATASLVNIAFAFLVGPEVPFLLLACMVMAFSGLLLTMAWVDAAKIAISSEVERCDS